MIPYEPGEPLTCQQIREIDTLAIEHVGVPGIVLMENAARSAAEIIYPTMVNPTTTRVVILCGAGNNGGDGFAIARHLRNAGANVTLILAAARDKLHGDARVNFRIYERLEAALLDASDQPDTPAIRDVFNTADIVIDALLGTGATGAPRGSAARLIEFSNAVHRARRVAIDIPSGLDADVGTVHEPCFRADLTITFVAPKVGFTFPAAREVLGRLVVVDIGAPHELIAGRGIRGRG